MPRLLAFEYNDAEARVAVASLRGGQMLVEQAFCVSLAGNLEGATVDVGQRLAAAAAARGLGRLDTVVAVGRTQVELRQLVVPPCPDEELPELVRFQAMREFSALKDDWPLDFLPGEDGHQQRTVLAAAIEPSLARQVEKTCNEAGLKLRRLVLRPCAVASLWRRGGLAGKAPVCLLVDPLAGEAELTVLVDGREVFLRSARLPGDPLRDPEALGALVAEIRRTMVAAQNQLGGRRVESIVLCGRGEACQQAAEQVGQRLEVPTTVFDPLAGVQCADDMALPEIPGRFASLLGTLQDELSRTAPAIDFLHPRKPPEAKGRRQTYVLAGLVAALLVLAGLGYRFWATNDLKAKIADLKTETNRLKPQVTEAETVSKAAAKIGEWVDTDVVWLDELRWLVEHLPSSEDAMLILLRCQPTRDGGSIDLHGYARSVDAIDLMDRDLREAHHDVKGYDRKADRTVSPYTYFFKSTVVIDNAASKPAGAKQEDR
ncbi:MAG: hypothetical protein JW818_17800 [Pirellulales bacterium]|nr:hypothetical protein [Pirellulales bacterium]